MTLAEGEDDEDAVSLMRRRRKEYESIGMSFRCQKEEGGQRECLLKMQEI